MPATKGKILDAAEKLFAESGIDGASLRAITDAAGVNLGSIHYYFKAKDQLVSEVLIRRMEQFNREGTAQLAAMKKYNLRSPVKDLWLVMIGSMLEFRDRHPDYLRFIQHLLASREQMVLQLILSKVDEFEKDFLMLLSEHFISGKRKQALTRCRVILEMLYQSILNIDLVLLSFKRNGLQLNHAQIADQFASTAVSALNEFMED
jgi:AcrR family transcriptional regulator